MVLSKPQPYEIGKTIVYLVRHGDHSPGDKGAQPGPGLSKLGVAQIKKTAKHLKTIKSEVDVFVSSDMTRALDSAKIIGKTIGKAAMVTQHCRESHPIIFTLKFFDPRFIINRLRINGTLRWFDALLTQYEGKVIVIVCHGDVIRAIVGTKLGLGLIKSRKFDIELASVTKLAFNKTTLDYTYNINMVDWQKK